jgi:hypothetical protein
MTYSTSRTRSSVTDITCRPTPHSYATRNDTDALQSPSGQRTQASWIASTQTPSCKTSTGRGSIRRTLSLGTGTTVERRAA